MSEDVLLARALLSRIAEPACVPLWDLVRQLGPVAAVRDIRAGNVLDAVRTATAVRLPTADPGADLDVAERHGIRLVVPESDEWPHFALSCLERTGSERVDEYRAGKTAPATYGDPVPPLALWVRGDAALREVGTRSVGIVGARAASPYGEHICADLSYGLARRGFTVVSGGAYGIDAAAHRGALGAGGETVLVSAGGLDRCYPPTNENLYRGAARSGLVVSESPPGSTPHRRRFLTRNRIIAALSGGCVVVEAARRSGAMNTAGHATRLGRPLMVVPGPVTSAASEGCHQLLQSEQHDAFLVTSVDDVLAIIGSSSDVPAAEAAGLSGQHGAAARGPGEVAIIGVRAALDRLDEVARAVYDGLPSRRAATPDDLALTAGTPVMNVIRSLPVLQLAGLVEASEGGYRRSAAARGAARVPS